MHKKIGIAITTYNRCDILLRQIELIRDLSVLDVTIIVCDDGSSDNTKLALLEKSVLRIGSTNRGIAWNKNRGVFYLFNYTDVDVVILMDDDVMPQIYGWDVEWLKAAQMYGHVNYIPPHLKSHIIGGDLTTENIAISQVVGGMCMAISREAFARVGYMDVRFGRYGHEHSDYSFRFVRAGYGGFKSSSGTTYFYVISGGVRLVDIPSTGTIEEANRNKELLFKFGSDPIYRLPWVDDEGYKLFLSEFDRFSTKITPDIVPIAYNFDEKCYFDANPDVKKSKMKGLQHYMMYGRFEKRRMKPK